MGSFEKDYFTKSKNYIEDKDYRKKKYTDLALEIKTILKLKKTDIILDYGCATGALIKELIQYCNCYGTDISEWAINYGKTYYVLEHELFHYDKNLLDIPINYVLLLDVLEHCPVEEINDVLTKCKNNKTLKKIIIRIPVSNKDGEDFVLDVSKNDKTHIQCRTKLFWETVFEDYGFKRESKIKQKNIYDSKGVLAWVMVKK